VDICEIQFEGSATNRQHTWLCSNFPIIEYELLSARLNYLYGSVYVSTHLFIIYSESILNKYYNRGDREL